MTGSIVILNRQWLALFWFLSCARGLPVILEIFPRHAALDADAIGEAKAVIPRHAVESHGLIFRESVALAAIIARMAA